MLGHEGGALMNGVSALIEKTPESSLAFLPSEDTKRSSCLWSTLSIKVFSILHKVTLQF